jgi:hypothetical protein
MFESRFAAVEFSFVDAFGGEAAKSINKQRLRWSLRKFDVALESKHNIPIDITR